MANWELTNQLSQYLDRHLVIPLLEFHTVNGMYDETDLSKGKLELLAHTSMVDFYIEEYKNLYPSQNVPEEMKEKRQAVVEEFRKLQEETKPLFDIFADPQVTVQVWSWKSYEMLLGFSILTCKYRFRTREMPSNSRNI